MKLHLNKTLYAAVLACMLCYTAEAYNQVVGSINTSTTTMSGTAYAGTIYKWDATRADAGNVELHTQTFTSSTDGTSWGSTDNPWGRFCHTQSGDFGHTLYLTGAGKAGVYSLNTSFDPLNLGGLVTEATNAGASYKIGRDGDSTTSIIIEAGNGAANLTIGANTILAGKGGYEIRSGGTWNIAGGKTLTFQNTQSANPLTQVSEGAVISIAKTGNAADDAYVSIGAGLQNNGTINLGQGVVLRVAGDLSGSGTISFADSTSKIAFDGLTVSGSTFDLSNVYGNLTGFSANNIAVNKHQTAVYDTATHIVSIEGDSVTWNGGKNGTWTTGGEGWTCNGAATEFCSWDDVIFTTTETGTQSVTVDGAGVSVGAMSVTGSFEFSGGEIHAVSGITINKGSEMRITRQYTEDSSHGITYWGAMKEAGNLISSISGEGKLVFVNAQNWQPGWDSSCGGAQLKLLVEGVKDGNGQVISTRNVVFEQGLTLMGAYNASGCDQQLNIKEGGNVTIKGQDFQNGRMAVNVSGGSLAVEQNLLIGFRTGGKNYAAAVTLSGTGKLSAGSIVGAGGNVDNNTFTMTGGELTITGDTAFTLADSDRHMKVSLTGGTIKTTQNASLVADTYATNNKLLFADMGGIAFEAAKDTTFTFNRNITQAGNITLKGEGGFAVASGTTVTLNSGELKADTADLTISGKVALGSGSGSVVADGGEVTLSGTGSITGTNVTIAVAQPTTATEPGPARSGADETSATLSNVTISNSGIQGGGKGGSVKNATVSMTGGDKTISGVTFEDSTLDLNLNEGATLSMSDVVFGAGATLSGAAEVSGVNKVVLTETAVNPGMIVFDAQNPADGVTLTYLGLGDTTFAAGSTLNLELTHDFIVALQKEVLPECTGVLTINFGDASLGGATLGTTTASYLAVENVAHAGDNGVTITFKKADAIPEPATGVLSMLALAGLAARRRRKA